LSRLDDIVIHWISLGARRSEHFDHFVSFLSTSLLLKGAWVMALLWFFWFSNRGEQESREDRVTIIAALLGSAAAVIIAKLIGRFGPFRLRPMYQPWFKVPYGILDRDYAGLRSLNSFPSDHAVVFGGFLTALFLLSWRTALPATLGVIVLILLPRIYLGFHYPSDVVLGTVLGVGCAMIAILLFHHTRPVGRISDAILRFKDHRPATFYALAFLFTLEYATLFEDVRHLFHLP
jgi:membrane-associated phospholipid phosphatase